MFGRRATSEKLAALTTGVGHHVPNPPKRLAMVPPGYRAMHKLPLQGYFHLRRLRRTSHPDLLGRHLRSLYCGSSRPVSHPTATATRGTCCDLCVPPIRMMRAILKGFVALRVALPF